MLQVMVENVRWMDEQIQTHVERLTKVTGEELAVAL
jgi:hypothetical protein